MTTRTDKELLEMDDRIDAFLKGQMSKEQESLFLEDCNKDPVLKERAYVTALLVKALKNK